MYLHLFKALHSLVNKIPLNTPNYMQVGCSLIHYIQCDQNTSYAETLAFIYYCIFEVMFVYSLLNTTQSVVTQCCLIQLVTS